MSEHRDNNPYAPLVLIEEEKDERKPGWLFGSAHTALVVLAALPFLFCLVSPLLLEYRAGWQNLRALLFVVGYIGLFFRKGWAYWLCVCIPMTWIIQIVIYLANATPDPDEPGLVMLFMMFYVAFAIWSAFIVLSALVCALSCWRRRKCNDISENMEP
jgi:NADH:ubiquinone oxidoreductase subunit K